MNAKNLNSYKRGLARPEPVAGVDEAGRGCLAGPVVAASVILPDIINICGLDDSKKLTPVKRTKLETEIKTSATAFALGVVWPPVIDRINILQATFTAMALAVSRLKPLPASIIVDGNHVIPEHIMAATDGCTGREPLRQTAVIGGDGKIAAVSAASILAKTFRDRLMLKLHKRYPEYGFDKHKGYGTKAHVAALKKSGPCRIHRMTFAKVKPAPKLQENLCLPDI